MIYYKPMTQSEGTPRSNEIDFPKGQNKELDLFLLQLKFEDPTRYKGILGSVRVLLARFFPIYPYMNSEDVRRGTSVQFAQRMLGAFSGHVSALQTEHEDNPDSVRVLTQLYLKGTQLTTRLLTSTQVVPREKLESKVFSATEPLGTRLNDIEKHTIHDLGIGIGLGDVKASVNAAENLVREAQTHCPRSRVPSVNNDVGDDFVHFLLIADLDHHRQADPSVSMEQE